MQSRIPINLLLEKKRQKLLETTGASWMSWSFQQLQYCVWAQSSAFLLLRVHMYTDHFPDKPSSPSYCQILKCGHWYVMKNPAWCGCCAKGVTGCSACEALNLAAQHVSKCFWSPRGSLCQSQAQTGADGLHVLLETGNLWEGEWLKRTLLLAVATFVAAC